MKRSSLFLLVALAGIYTLAKLVNVPRRDQFPAPDHDAEAQWANEGGGNPATTV